DRHRIRRGISARYLARLRQLRSRDRPSRRRGRNCPQSGWDGETAPAQEDTHVQHFRRATAALERQAPAEARGVQQVCDGGEATAHTRQRPDLRFPPRDCPRARGEGQPAGDGGGPESQSAADPSPRFVAISRVSRGPDPRPGILPHPAPVEHGAQGAGSIAGGEAVMSLVNRAKLSVKLGEYAVGNVTALADALLV